MSERKPPPSESDHIFGHIDAMADADADMRALENMSDEALSKRLEAAGLDEEARQLRERMNVVKPLPRRRGPATWSAIALAALLVLGIGYAWKRSQDDVPVANPGKCKPLVWRDGRAVGAPTSFSGQVTCYVPALADGHVERFCTMTVETGPYCDTHGRAEWDPQLVVDVPDAGADLKNSERTSVEGDLVLGTPGKHRRELVILVRRVIDPG